MKILLRKLIELRIYYKNFIKCLIQSKKSWTTLTQLMMKTDSLSDKDRTCMTLTDTTSIIVNMFTNKSISSSKFKTTSNYRRLKLITKRTNLSIADSMWPRTYGIWENKRPYWLSKETKRQSPELSTNTQHSKRTEPRSRNSLWKWTLPPLKTTKRRTMTNLVTLMTFLRSIMESCSLLSTNWATLESIESMYGKSTRLSTVSTRLGSTLSSSSWRSTSRSFTLVAS